MATLTIDEAQIRLSEILQQMAPGDEVVITRDGVPVGRLLPPELPKGVPILGRGKGKILDFDHEDKSHLEVFKEYME